MGDKRVAVAGVGAGDDLGEGMQCSDHPYRSNPGGICAFCLQEKLGKLVSSSKSSPFFAPPPSTSSSSSPTSFRSDGLGFGFGAGAGGLAGSASSGLARTGAGGGSRTRIPFLAAAHRKKKSSSYVNSGNSRKDGRERGRKCQWRRPEIDDRREILMEEAGNGREGDDWPGRKGGWEGNR